MVALVSLRYNVEKNTDIGKKGVPEWPLIIQNIVVDTHNPSDEAGTCRLKYHRLGVHHNQLWGE